MYDTPIRVMQSTDDTTACIERRCKGGIAYNLLDKDLLPRAKRYFLLSEEVSSNLSVHPSGSVSIRASDIQFIFWLAFCHERNRHSRTPMFSQVLRHWIWNEQPSCSLNVGPRTRTRSMHIPI
jgi:hypothetical protein